MLGPGAGSFLGFRYRPVKVGPRGRGPPSPPVEGRRGWAKKEPSISHTAPARTCDLCDIWTDLTAGGGAIDWVIYSRRRAQRLLLLPRALSQSAETNGVMEREREREEYGRKEDGGRKCRLVQVCVPARILSVCHRTERRLDGGKGGVPLWCDGYVRLLSTAGGPHLNNLCTLPLTWVL